LFVEAAEKYSEALSIDSSLVERLRNQALEIMEQAQQNRRLYYAAAQLFRALSMVNPMDPHVLFEWGNALINYAASSLTDTRRAELYQSAGEQFMRVLTIDPTYLDGKIKDAVMKQGYAYI